MDRPDVLDPVISFLGNEFLPQGTVSKKWIQVWRRTGKPTCTSVEACATAINLKKTILEYENTHDFSGREVFREQFGNLERTTHFLRWYFQRELTELGIRRMMRDDIGPKFAADLGIDIVNRRSIPDDLKLMFIETLGRCIHETAFFSLHEIGTVLIENRKIDLLDAFIRVVGTKYVRMGIAISMGSEEIVRVIRSHGVKYVPVSFNQAVSARMPNVMRECLVEFPQYDYFVRGNLRSALSGDGMSSDPGINLECVKILVEGFKVFGDPVDISCEHLRKKHRCVHDYMVSL